VLHFDEDFLDIVVVVFQEYDLIHQFPPMIEKELWLGFVLESLHTELKSWVSLISCNNF